MGMEDADDLAGFFDLDEHATTAEWTPVGGVPVPGVVGIFEEPYYAEAVTGIESAQPVFRCPASAVDGVMQDDGLVVRLPTTGIAVAYVVAEVQPDGAGVVDLALRKA